MGLEADAAFEKRVRGEPAPEGGLKAAYVLRMLGRQVRDAAGQYLRTFPQALDRSPLDPFKFFFGLQTVLPGSGTSFGSKYASFRALMESQVFDESAACGMCSDQAKLQRLLRMQLAAGAKADGVHLAEASYRNLATLLRSTGMFCGNEAEVKALLDTLIVTHNHFPEECNGTVVPFVAHAVAHVLVKAAKVQNDLDAALAGCAEAVRDEAKKGPCTVALLREVIVGDDEGVQEGLHLSFIAAEHSGRSQKRGQVPVRRLGKMHPVSFGSRRKLHPQQPLQLRLVAAHATGGALIKHLTFHQGSE